MTRKKISLFVLLGIIILVFRTFMGFSKFWSHDEIQIYLIGLKSFTNDVFPYYGPDVVYTETQIPGGLQGLLVSMPLTWLKTPEAPFILLNILSFSALTFFAWYLSKRILNVPKWFIYMWLFTSPWTIEYSTHIENPSYVILGAILFFVAIFELGKFYESRIISPNLSFFFLGFAIFWIMQLHLSWVLMLPFVAWIYWENRREIKLLIKGSLFMLLGATLSISALIPTILKGFGSGDVESNVVFNSENLFQIPTIIARFMMFASYEITRYIGADTPARIDFLTENFWAIPLVFFLLFAGLFQTGYFIFSFFKKNDLTEWKRVKWFTFFTLMLVSASFIFSVSQPKSHTFYILYPVAIWYSFYCYGNLFKKRRIEFIAKVFITAGILFQISLFIDRYDDRSLFEHREVVVKAIAERDYTFVGLRRESKMMKEKKKVIWKHSKSNNQIIRSTSYDVADVFFKPQNIVGKTKYSGNFSCKIDSIQQFGVTFSESLKSLGSPKKVSVKFRGKSKQLDNFVLVRDIHDGGETRSESIRLGALDRKRLNWDLIELEFDLEPYSSESEISIFFWAANKTAATLYVDDLTLVFE